MTSWLKWRLCALFGSCLFVGGAAYLHAQSTYPAPPSTPEDAGAQFFQMLNSVHVSGSDALGLDESRDDTAAETAPIGANFIEAGPSLAPINGSISRVQFQALMHSSFKFRGLLESLFQKANETQYSARVSGIEGEQTIVEVAPSAQLKSRDVVVVAEDGGYRVDLRATYGLWSNKSGTQLDEDWYGYTGEVSTSLGQEPNFLRSQCRDRLREQMLAMMQYAQDYDEWMPPARTWVDALKPYAKLEQTFRCPSLHGEGNGYAYNQYLSRLPQWKMAEPATLINIYETSNPKRNWFGDGTGRAYRHSNGWNVAFADCHTKWFQNGGPTNAQFKPLIAANAKPSLPMVPPPPIE